MKKPYRWGFVSRELSPRITPKSAFLRKLERMQRGSVKREPPPETDANSKNITKFLQDAQPRNEHDKMFLEFLRAQQNRLH